MCLCIYRLEQAAAINDPIDRIDPSDDVIDMGIIDENYYYQSRSI
jgi:hypothetical protein